MRTILRLINEVSLARLLLTLLGLVVLFALAFWGLTRLDPTLVVETYGEAGPLSFLDALYFSVVTLSSLGYGDIRPQGITRLFAGAEVVLGLAFFGIIVAKISSAKQDYILRRLYSDVTDAKLERFVDAMNEAGKLYRLTSTMLLDGDIDPELTHTFKADVAEATFFYQTHQILHDLHDLMAFEVRNGGFFGDVSDAHISQLFAGMQSMMQHTLSLVERDSQAACRYVLCGNERWIGEMVELAEDMARIGRKGSHNADICEQCSHLLVLAQRVRTEVLPLVQTAGSDA